MENIDNPVPKWHAFTKSDLEKLTKDELIDRLLELQKYLESVGSNRRSDNWNTNPELVTLRESEEKLKQQQIEATRKENVLVMRLTSKEQEMQEYVNQIQELKQSQMPSVSQLRSMLTDPAINLLFKGLKKELENTKAKLEETQNELSAWKFTPDSNTGKRLMAKCRLLFQENEELGKVIASGKLAKLEGDLALQRNFSEEMRKSQSELDEYLLEVEEEVEGMHGTIVFLQQQLREAKEQLNILQTEKEDKLSDRTSSDNSINNNNHDKVIRTDNDRQDSNVIQKICADKDRNVQVDSSDSQISKSDNLSEDEDNRTKSTTKLYNGEHSPKLVEYSTHPNSLDDKSDDPKSRKSLKRSLSPTPETVVKQEIDESVGRTPNGDDKSSEFRTKKSKSNDDDDDVDNEMEVQVAETLASWATCDNNTDHKKPVSNNGAANIAAIETNSN